MKRAAAGLVAAAALAVLLGIVMMGGIVGAVADTAAAAPAAGCVPAAAPAVAPAATGAAPTLDAEQAGNAATIIAVGRRDQVPTPGLKIGIITAMTESGLRNLPYGDRDSVGLFQQRPSQGWGSVTEILQPEYAADRFFTALLTIPGWQQMQPGAAAQAVQRSAFPDRYAKWLPLADAILGGTTAVANAACTVSAAAAAPAPGPGGLTFTGSPAGNSAVAFALKQLGKPYLWGGTGPNAWDCSGLTQAAWASAGVSIPRVTYSQATTGSAVGVADVRSGDLVLTAGSDGTPTNPGHVGMVAGTDSAGRVWLVEAPRTGLNVRVVPVADWANQITTIRRVG